MRTANMVLALCAAATFMGASTQAVTIPTPAIEFTFVSGDYTNTGTLGGSGNIAIRDGGSVPSSTLSAAGVNPYAGNTTLQSLLVPGIAGGVNERRIKSLNIADGGLFNVGHAGAATAMTLSFWVNPTALSGSLAARANDSGQGWILGIGAGDSRAGGLRFSTADGNFDTSDTTPANQMTINTWQFITLTWDSATGQADLYRNGVDLNVETWGGSVKASTDVAATFTVGTAGTYGAIDGNMSAVRVWDSAFTPSLVGELYVTEMVPEPTSLALLGVCAMGALRRRRA